MYDTIRVDGAHIPDKDDGSEEDPVVPLVDQGFRQGDEYLGRIQIIAMGPR